MSMPRDITEQEDFIHQQFMEFLHLSTEEMYMDSSQIMSNVRRAGSLSLAFRLDKKEFLEKWISS